MKVEVFSKNNCPQCKMVKRWLDEHAVNYTEINVEENEAERLRLTTHGFQTVPVTMINSEGKYTEMVHGFRPSDFNRIFKGGN